MTDAVREAIEAGDDGALRRLVEADAALADADVRWGDGGENAVPPLHFVCDAVFRGLVSQERALAMAHVLLEAGVDPDRAYARSGDTFLIAAASLGARAVGLRLLERGVDFGARGLFGATALHWAANMGLDRLAGALLDAGAKIDLRDRRYDCTPLEWGIHAWRTGTKGDRDGVVRAARVLVGRGAEVPSEADGELSAA